MKRPSRAHYLQHVPFEDLAGLAPRLRQAGFDVSRSRLWAGETLPDPGALDMLIVLGGPMSANDEQACPWMTAEKRFIHSSIERGTPVLGICLGAQLIASVLGARVYKNAVKEIGWFPVHGVTHAQKDRFLFPASFDAFHWHGETFDLPAGALWLAKSAACAHQAFQCGPSTIGLQFHLETSPEAARALVTHCRHELTAGPYVQTTEEILGTSSETYAVMHYVLDELLAYCANALTSRQEKNEGRESRT